MSDRRTHPRRADEPPRVITDPKAIRALAHPARLAVLDALGDDEEMTATALSAVAGLTPSAMSYHLRALQKWGFVERVEGGGDGRERPWRRIPGGWNIEPLPDAAMVAATSALTNLTLGRAATDIERWFGRERDQPDEWRHAALVADQQAWLTAEEAEELRAQHDGFLDGRKGRTAKNHPAGARRVRVVRVVAPLHFD